MTGWFVYSAALSSRLLVGNLITLLLGYLGAALTMSTLVRSWSSPLPLEVVSSLREVQRVGLHLRVQAPLYSILISPAYSASLVINRLETAANSTVGLGF